MGGLTHTPLGVSLPKADTLPANRREATTNHAVHHYAAVARPAGDTTRTVHADNQRMDRAALMRAEKQK